MSPYWTPQPVWQGKDCFVLGGGPSLRGWDFSLLAGERVIGCNHAFRHGPDICDYVVFADKTFLCKTKNEWRQPEFDLLAKFPKPVVTNHEGLRLYDLPWLKIVKRRPTGLYTDALGYNRNTGAVGINLALLLGATTIYLLGFDMTLGDGKRANYHDHSFDRPKQEVYEIMLRCFPRMANDLAKKFPESRVFNVTSGSDLVVFPKISFDKFWKERKQDNGLVDGTFS